MKKSVFFAKWLLAVLMTMLLVGCGSENKEESIDFVPKETTEAIAEVETTEAETTGAETKEEASYADGVYYAKIELDDIYDNGNEKHVVLDILEKVYLEDTYVQFLAVGSVIDMSQYGLDPFFVDEIERYDDWLYVNYTYSIYPDPQGSDKWILAEANDIPVTYVSETMDIAFAEDVAVLDYTSSEKEVRETPEEFFRLHDYIDEWPVTVIIENNKITDFAYEYRP